MNTIPDGLISSEECNMKSASKNEPQTDDRNYTISETHVVAGLDLHRIDPGRHEKQLTGT
jgi:hypothetical protein